MNTVIYIVMQGNYDDDSSAIPLKAFRTKEEANEFVQLMKLDNNRRLKQGEHCENCPAYLHDGGDENSCLECIKKAKLYCNNNCANLTIDKYDNSGKTICYVDCDKRETIYDDQLYYVQECDFVEGI